MKKCISMVWMALVAVCNLSLSACSDDDDKVNNEQTIRDLATGIWSNAAAEGMDAIYFGTDQSLMYIQVSSASKKIKKGTFELKGSNKLTIAMDGEEYAAELTLNGDEITTTYDGVRTTFTRSMVNTNLSLAGKSYTAVGKCYTYISFKDGKTTVTLPENLQAGDSKELKLINLTSRYEQFFNGMFQNLSFTNDKEIVIFTTESGEQTTVDLPYSLEKTSKGGYDINVISLQMGFLGLPYTSQQNLFATEGRLCSTTDRDMMISDLAYMYCNLVGNQYGKTFTESNAQQLIGLIDECIEDYTTIFLLKEN